MLLYFRVVLLVNSAKAYDNIAFQRIQKIARYTYQTFAENSELIDEFISLCSSKLMFVND